MKRKNVLSGVLCGILIQLTFTPIYGQYRLPEVTIPSPTAAALGLYGEVPVNLSTGLSQISVPLHEVQEGPINLPISLNYHASGVRPDQRPGWVGLNWSLNAGGVITRVAKDLPDEYDCPNNTVSAYHYSLAEFNGIEDFFNIGMTGEKAGYFYNRTVNQGSDWNDATKIDNLVNNSLDGKDTEPDEFNFNFLGYSGKFFLDEAGTWQVLSEDNIKVVFENNNFIDLPQSILVSRTKHYQAWCSRISDNLKSFGGFTLITDDGTKYVFGSSLANVSTDGIEYSIPFFQQMFDQWMATSWYLTKIISPEGRSISFTYEPDDFISNMYIYYLWKVEIFLNNNDRVACPLYGLRSDFGSDGEVTADWINPRFASYLGNLIRPVYLKEINTTHTRIVFERSASNDLNYHKSIYLKNSEITRVIRSQKFTYQACKGGDSSPEKEVEWPFLYDVIPSSDNEELLNALRWKKLDNIKIINKNIASEGQQYTFSYNNVSTDRLMLNSISKKSLNGLIDIRDYFTFSYFDSPFVFLPSYFSEKTDHWGFLNDNTLKGFTSLRTPQYTDNGPPNIDVIHEPTQTLERAVEGSLKSISYPTGGSATFEYEQHQYSKTFDITNCDNTIANCIIPHSTIQKAGGLRIKSITTRSSWADTKPIVKQYLYVAGYTPTVDVNTLSSSGILGGKNQYFWQDYNPKVQNAAVKKVKRTIISSQSILPLSTNSSGTHIGYSEVVEKRNDGAYTIYKFTNFVSADGNHFDEKPYPGSYNDLTPYTSLNDRSHERGNLIDQSVFNSSGKLVSQYKATYSTYSTKFVRALFLTSNTYPCANDNLFTSYLGVPYKLFIYKYLKSKEETTSYDVEGNNPITKVAEHNFGIYNSVNIDYYLLNEEKNYGINTTDFLSTTYRYPDQFMGNIAMKSMVLVYDMIGTPIEIIRKKGSKVVGSSFTSFQCKNCVVTGGFLQGGFLKPYQSYELETKSALSDYSLASSTMVLDSRLKPKVLFDNFDDKGNVLQYHKIDDTNSSYIWGYSNTLPIAEVTGASYVELTSAATAAGFNITELNGITLTEQQIRDRIQLLRARLPNAQIISYTYNPFMGITSKTHANGIVEFYEYDALGRLKLIKDLNQNIVKMIEYNYQIK